ncbi:hypothetical protein OAD50_00165 [Vicingaceae bacterium]|nr:hypothetical protein [Vicingaceae bacterium]MDB9963494.1 hypothetical protein [Vicingaceae bacterium]MDC1451639.1 hypothetical protein [Vicingaceae bacterium]
MAIFTHFDFQELTDNENNLNHQLHQEKKEVQHSPSKISVQNILAFSKALSIRKSDNFSFIENVLN